MKYTITFLLITISAIIVKAQPGTLDMNFGNQGILPLEKYNAVFNCITAADKRIIIGGRGGFDDHYGLFMLGLKSDGDPDFSFGDRGRVATNVSQVAQIIIDIEVQTDGKIIVAGRVEFVPNQSDIVVVRYMNDGTLDSSFGTNGISTVSVGKYDFVNDLTIQSDGKILIIGNRQNDDNDTETFFVVRYLSNGILDADFGNSGVLVTSFCCPIEVHTILVQPDNKILIGGEYTFDKRYFVMRLLPDGSTDISFGTNGKSFVIFGEDFSDAYMRSMALQSDGNILLSGSTFTASDYYKPYLTIARLNDNGSLDNTFGQNGILINDIGELGSEVSKLLIQDDGRIIASGTAYEKTEVGYYQVSKIALSRYMQNGSIDNSFGQNGVTITDVGIYPKCFSAALQTDGKILLQGISGSTYFVARYNGGEATLPVTYKHFTASQKNGAIVLNWQTTTETNNKFFVVEHSRDAVHFSERTTVNSTGSNAYGSSYSYTDKIPVSSDNYYRLKQVNTDGHYSYSKTIHISFANLGDVKIQPNPVHNILQVIGMAAVNSHLIITDVSGKELKRFTVKESTAKLDISNILPGTYLLTVQNIYGIHTIKFLKQ